MVTPVIEDANLLHRVGVRVAVGGLVNAVLVAREGSLELVALVFKALVHHAEVLLALRGAAKLRSCLLRTRVNNV